MRNYISTKFRLQLASLAISVITVCNLQMAYCTLKRRSALLNFSAREAARLGELIKCATYRLTACEYLIDCSHCTMVSILRTIFTQQRDFRQQNTTVFCCMQQNCEYHRCFSAISGHFTKCMQLCMQRYIFFGNMLQNQSSSNRIFVATTILFDKL